MTGSGYGNSTPDKDNAWTDISCNMSVLWYDVSGRLIPKDDPSEVIHQHVMVVNNVMTTVLMGMMTEEAIHFYRCEARYHLCSHQSVLTVSISGISNINTFQI